jgi:uncharacterized protein YijF (DUF1287 family)
MQAHWSQYPRYEALDHPDSNIDHRRVPNQRVFFSRYGKSLTLGTARSQDWLPGDFVSWKLANGRDHIGILSDHLDDDGFPLVIHNIGAGPQEDDVLRSPTWRITGHYRYPLTAKPAAPSSGTARS